MKKSIKTTIIILVIILIIVWIVSKMPFATNINQTITAEKYVNGAAVEETSVFINGVRSNYLFSDKQYYEGQFIIESYEITGREGMKANIVWYQDYEDSDVQRILYFQNALFPSLEICHEMLINNEMDEFAMGFKDGTVISTSDEMFENYIKNYMKD